VTNLSLENLPPSKGKLVIKTPFLEAGVPASMMTRRTYGVYAGGKRMYWDLTVSLGDDALEKETLYRGFFGRTAVRIKAKFIDTNRRFPLLKF